MERALWDVLEGRDESSEQTFVLDVPGGVVLRRCGHMVYVPMVGIMPAPDGKVKLISTFAGQTAAIMEASLNAASRAIDGERKSR